MVVELIVRMYVVVHKEVESNLQDWIFSCSQKFIGRRPRLGVFLKVALTGTD